MVLTSLPPGCLHSPSNHLGQVLAQLQGCLCFSVGFPTRPWLWSTEGFQLGLVIGASCSGESRLALLRCLAGRPWSVAGVWPENQVLAFPKGPWEYLEAELLEVGFYLSEGSFCWTEGQTRQDGIHNYSSTRAAAKICFSERKSHELIC